MRTAFWKLRKYGQMKFNKTVVLIFAVLIAALLLAGCSDKTDPASSVDTGGGVSDPEHGGAVSVTYSCAGGENVEDTFSFYAAKEDEGFLFRYYFYDQVKGLLEGERQIGEDDMNTLRTIVEVYGYAEKAGQRIDPDFGNDEAPDAPTYYLEIGFEDGRSMSADTAGDGGAELEAFFRSLAEKEN